MPSPSEPVASAPATPSPLGIAFRIAVAAVISLFVSETLHLAYASLAVWTCHLVMVKYDHTVFQKGFERLLGRFLGILAGLVLLAVFPDAAVIRIGVEAILVITFFYFYFAQRLAYTFLNAGILTITIIGIGDLDPNMAYTASVEILVALVIGIGSADLVMWLTSSEWDLHIQTGLEPLWPLRLDWLNHSAMLTVSGFLALFLTELVALPVPQSIISVFVLGIAPDIHEGVRKGELRLLGAILALVWGGMTFFIVVYLPHFLIFAGVLFFGMLLAAYLARASTTYSYAGLQMGLVLPMLVVAPPNEFGDVQAVASRLEGILAALCSTLIVGVLWPPFYQSAQPAPSPIQK